MVVQMLRLPDCRGGGRINPENQGRRHIVWCADPDVNRGGLHGLNARAEMAPPHKVVGQPL
jgi:hypothetical protein